MTDTPTPAEQIRHEMDEFIDRINRKLLAVENQFYVDVDQIIYARQREWQTTLRVDRHALQTMVGDAFRSYLANARKARRPQDD